MYVARVHRLRQPDGGTWTVLGLAAVLVLAAVLLLPALRDERRLERASAALPAHPAVAIREADAATGPSTLDRVREVEIQAYLQAGDPGAAERVAEQAVRATPDDTLAIRRLYTVQRIAGRRAPARRTLRHLRRLDPEFVSGRGS